MKKPKNLRKVYWLHPHFYNWMGGHKYIYEVVSRLQNEYELDITLVTSGLAAEAERHFPKNKFKVITTFGWSTNHPGYWLLLPLFLWLEKIYLIHFKKIDRQALFISTMFPANALATSISTRTVQLCYEPFAFFYDQSFVAGFSTVQQSFIKLIKFLYQAADKRAVQAQQLILTISQHNQKWIQSSYGVTSKVIYEGVDLTFFKPTSNKKLAQKYHGHSLIFHATDYTPIKGTEFLIKALPEVIKRSPNALVIISETLPHSPAKKQILKLISDLKLQHYIQFGGFLPYDLLPAYLSLAQVVVQPSIQQSMNLTVKEAMACGTPIITSLEGHEQTKNGEAGFLVDPHDSKKLAQLINKILTETSLATKMKQKGRNIIKERFSWESVTQRLWTHLQPYLYV